MASMEQLAETLESVNTSTFDGDEVARMKVLQAAEGLVRRLQQPWEIMYRMILAQPLHIASMRIGTDLNLWSHLTTSPQSAAQLAEKTECDASLLRRLLRVLVTMQVVEEVDVDAYAETEFSKALRDPNGLVNGLGMYRQWAIITMTRLPEYLKTTGYREPVEFEKAPWKWMDGIPDSPLSRWEWLDQQGQNKMFNSFLSSVRLHQPPWATLWPLKEKALDGWDPSTVFMVDVGGGKGKDISGVAHVTEKTHPDARLVLQDRASVLQEAKENGTLHPKVETMVHDFFKPNPVHGARVYFLHSVLHDWPDKEAREILKQIKPVMTPGYSKLLLMERVMPLRGKEINTDAACMDLQMMVNFSARERTEAEWKRLLESAGFKYAGHQPASGAYNVLEAEI